MPADAEPAGRCNLECWREAYADLVAPDRLAVLVADVDERVALWRQIIAGPVTVRLAEDDGTIVGFASVGPPLEPDAGTDRQLYAIYVRQAYWGTGLGHRLLTETLGDASALLWVFRDNTRAVKFYTQHGFVPDGAEQEEPRFGGIEIRMVRDRVARPTAP